MVAVNGFGLVEEAVEKLELELARAEEKVRENVRD